MLLSCSFSVMSLSLTFLLGLVGNRGDQGVFHQDQAHDLAAVAVLVLDADVFKKAGFPQDLEILLQFFFGS